MKIIFYGGEKHISRISERLAVFTNEYVKVILSFTIKNCRTYDDALELGDEMITSCIYAINKDETIDNFNAYFDRLSIY